MVEVNLVKEAIDPVWRSLVPGVCSAQLLQHSMSCKSKALHRAAGRPRVFRELMLVLSPSCIVP
eukprot:2799690-Amphidinium_carterae.1